MCVSLDQNVWRITLLSLYTDSIRLDWGSASGLSRKGCTRDLLSSFSGLLQSPRFTYNQSIIYMKIWYGTNVMLWSFKFCSLNWTQLLSCSGERDTLLTQTMFICDRYRTGCRMLASNIFLCCKDEMDSMEYEEAEGTTDWSTDHWKSRTIIYNLKTPGIIFPTCKNYRDTFAQWRLCACRRPRRVAVWILKWSWKKSHWLERTWNSWYNCI